MTRRRDRRFTQVVAFSLSAVVALSMVISLVGPLLLRPAAPRHLPTPTWPPTWTPAAGFPTVEPVVGLTFAVCGSSREGSEVYARLLERVAVDGSAFLIHTGNLVASASPESYVAFRAQMANFSLPFYPAAGSLDRDRDGSLTSFLQYSGAPAAHYAFDVGQIHLAVVNSAAGFLDDDELAWIDSDLASSDRPVTIVVTHYPPFDLDGSGHVLSEGGEAFAKLMRKHRVAHVFTGHTGGYAEVEREGTRYVALGGPGPAAAAGQPDAFYHYARVSVVGAQVSTEIVRID